MILFHNLMSNPLIVDQGSALADGASWQAALLARVSATMTSVLNEFGIAVQVVFMPTTATASYEKDALIIQCEQHDLSDSKNGVMKMGVALDARNKIAGNNPSGYAYAGYFEVGCEAGSAGQMNGVEIGGNNQGPPAAKYGTFGAASCLDLVAGEYADCNTMTNAISIVGGSSKFSDGAIIIETASVADGAPLFRVISNVTGQDVFRINADGSIQTTKVITP
jgi:hypothetical protein